MSQIFLQIYFLLYEDGLPVLIKRKWGISGSTKRTDVLQYFWKKEKEKGL